jgi:Site-specific DNA methylase
LYTLNLFSNQFEEATANYPPQPFLKWPGGKRQIIKEIKRFIPSDIDTYYEPFVGGGGCIV